MDETRHGTEPSQPDLRTLQERIAALEQQVAEYQQLVENAPLGIYRTTPDGRVLLANRMAVDLVGFSSFEEMTRHNIEKEGTAFTYPRQQFKERMDRDGEVRGLEATWVKLDGALRIVRENARIVRGAEGEALFYEGTLEDITERRHAEESLRQARDELERRVQERTAELAKANDALRSNLALVQAIVEGTTDAIYVKDREGRYLLANSGVARNTGLTAEQLLGTDGSKAWPPDTFRQIRADDERIMATGQTESYERTLNIAEVSRTFLVTKGPYRDHNGRVIGVLGISRDITERKLLEDQLRQAHKMEAIGRLAGGVAHDFNNLLTAILGFTNLLLSDAPAGTSLRADLEQIHKAGERAAALTRQLLAFSRKQLIQPRVFHLNSLIRDLYKLLLSLTGENVELITVLAADLRPVRADPSQIEQLVLNLVVNARDALHHGGKIIIETANVALHEAALRGAPQARPGPFTLLRVRDTGCGMDEQTLAHVFEPFFTTKGPGKGTGLGLAIVYGAVQQANGHITVDSAPDKGTTFRVYLPSVAEPVTEARSPVAIPATQKPVAATVLVVEDEQVLRTLVRTILEQDGYTVLQAADGAEAVRLMNQPPCPVHLMITDVVMPGLNGRQVAEKVLARHPGLKVLYISGYNDEAIFRRGLLEPGTALLHKPFTPSALSRRVREMLNEPTGGNGSR